jgi:hypothetical protein
VTLTATGNATNYAWSDGVGNGVGFTPFTTKTYTVIGTSALSCTAQATIPVTVVTTPITPPTANPIIVCIGNSSTLSAVGASNYTWTSGTQTVNTADFVVTPALGISTYTVTKANANCVDTKTINVITNALPTIFAIASPTVVCAANPATLSVGGGQTYTWTAPSPPNFTFTGASPVVSPQGPSTYTVAASDGTCINTTTVFLNANPNPSIVVTVNNPTICVGQSVTLNATGADPNTYSWTVTNSTVTSTSSSLQDAPLIPTSYNVSGSNQFGCSSIGNAIVLVYPNPTISIVASKNLVCSGDPSTLTASGANSYTWDANANNALTPSAIVNPVSNITGPVIYTVQGQFNTTGCQSTKTVAVSVFVPTLSVSGNTNTCFGGAVNLVASGGNPNTYTWNTGSGQPYTFANLTTTLTAPAQFTVSAITTSISVNCPSSQTVDLGIYFNPTVTAVPERTFYCRNEILQLYASGAQTYSWSNSMSGDTITVSPSSNTNYTVTGTDVNGCSSTGTLQVRVNTCTGLNEVAGKTAHIQVYPNPNNGEFMVQTDSDLSLNLVNELGQVIRVIDLKGANSHKVNVSGVAQGIYFITGNKDGVSIHQKIVVTR